MPTCSAPNCSNKTIDNIRLFRFPSNPDRRNKWTANCGRLDWTPSVNARICEVHFEDSQFELRRLDNHRKLKPCAVPTLFSDKPLLKKKRKNKKQSKDKTRNKLIKELSQYSVHYDPLLSEPSTSKSSKPEYKAKALIPSSDTNILKQNAQLVVCNKFTEISFDVDIVFPPIKKEPSDIIQNNKNTLEFDDKESVPLAQLQRQYKKIKKTDIVDNNCEKIIEDIKKENSLAKEIRTLCNIRELQRENDELKNLVSGLEKFFNKEQLKHLTKADSNEKIHEWSRDCILKCLKLKSAIGWDGYRYLLSIGYPGPVVSTLFRHLKRYRDQVSKEEIDTDEDKNLVSQ